MPCKAKVFMRAEHAQAENRTPARTDTARGGGGGAGWLARSNKLKCCAGSVLQMSAGRFPNLCDSDRAETRHLWRSSCA